MSSKQPEQSIGKRASQKSSSNVFVCRNINVWKRLPVSPSVFERNHSSGWLQGFPGLFANTSQHIRFYFLVLLSVFPTFQSLVPCGRWSWLTSAFERTLKLHLVSYRVVSKMHRFELEAWDKQTDRQTDRRIAAVLNALRRRPAPPLLLGHATSLREKKLFAKYI